ncbi:MAG TPA: outer membrane beta-barrel protein, partial [Puia sp.]
SVEKGSETGIRSEIAAVSKRDRSADIILPEMASDNSPSLSMKEKGSAQKNLPDLAEISDAVTASEKTITNRNPMRNDRFRWEIYISPTLNTRHLDGVDYHNVSQTIQNAPITVVRFANVNGFVDNTPAMGYDLGGNVLYRLSQSLSLKAGLQFSFSRYYINAYNSNQPQSSAALNSYFGYIADSISNNSQGRNVAQKNPQHYQNKYYQLSMPVGIEWKVAGKGRLQFHAGATIQPGYLLNRDAYVLSSDYSSYSKEPAALRKWNLNAGAEIFLSYRLGKIRWELGPMLRYQILSTYKDSYPLKENLMNYGIRLGFSKTIR